MEALSTQTFAAVLALVGVVIVVASLLSGLIERSNFPQVAVFLALGAVLGPSGLGLLDVALDSPILRVVATLSLALVLFTDAVSLSIPKVRKHAGLTLLVLGPGTLTSAALVALSAWWLLGLAPAAAVILGAALASTDPVLLRGLLRRPGLPASARLALRLESGLNDVVLLPIVLVAMLFLGRGHSGEETNWARLAIDLFLLGPAAGVLVGLLAVATLDLVRRRAGVRRDYESLYSLGVCFAAFAAAEAVHGSGFLAAFTAGMTIAALDVELCDCFLEYGETTAELALLFTFVLLGSSLIWSGLALLTLASGLFALVTLLIRPVSFLGALAPTKLDKKSRLLIAWFGPRGLSSLLLVLLPVFAGVPGSGRIFSLCCLVVVFSVTLHGSSIMLLGRHIDQAEKREEGGSAADAAEPSMGATFASATPQPLAVLPLPREPAARDGAAPTGAGADGSSEGAPSGERVTIAEMQTLLERGKPVVVLDVRTERTFNDSDSSAQGAVRLRPDGAAGPQAEALRLPRDAWLRT